MTQSSPSTSSIPLKGYIAGALGTATLLAAPQADAAVTAVTFGFGSVLDSNDGDRTWSVGSYGLIVAGADSNRVFMGKQPSQSSGMAFNTPLAPGTGLAKFFSGGETLGTGSYTNSGNNIGYAWFFYNGRPEFSFGSNQSSKNIGFETTTGNWGWANVSYDNTTKSIAINSAYVESVAGASINVGDVGAVPEPSRALLALAGLGGVALRRRRKQAV